MIRTLIVDDESIARKVLRDELEAFKDVEIVGEADNGQEALRLIEARQLQDGRVRAYRLKEATQFMRKQGRAQRHVRWQRGSNLV